LVAGANRQFLALAKDVLYPGSRSTPPWAKLSESPEWFFDSDDVPEVDYDDGRRKVILQDPSRMKNHELNACLHLWHNRQKEKKPSFRFHHWWSEGQKDYIQAQEPQSFNSDADEDPVPAASLSGPVNTKAKTKKTETGKASKKSRQHKGKSKELGDEQSILHLQDTMSKHGKDFTSMACGSQNETKKIHRGTVHERPSEPHGNNCDSLETNRAKMKFMELNKSRDGFHQDDILAVV
jgi:hypothetical protein